MGVEQTSNTVKLTHVSGSSAEIYLYGATVTSWVAGGKERLFVSSKSAMDGSKAIRGGVPVVFPIFGPPPSSPPEYAALKQHGFARNQTWELTKTIMDRDSGVSVRFTAPAPPSEFGHKYKLAYVVTLTEHELSTDIHITNEDDKDFIFQTLLHTYLAVPDSSKLSISGLDNGIKYVDKIDGGKTKDWDGAEIKIEGPVDRVYHKVPSQEIKLDYGDGSNGLNVRFRGFEDTTIWNPTESVGKDIADMEAGGWASRDRLAVQPSANRQERYVCIEPGYVREFKTLKPGEEFLGQQVMRVL